MKRILHIFDLRKPVVGLAVTVFVLALLLVLKAINRVGCPQFWAEDGTIFFAELLKSGWRSIFVVYAGYLHVGTRLCAASAMAFDPINAPVVFFYAAFLVQLVVMVVIARCGIFRSYALGLVAAATLVFQPFGGYAEVFLNLTNLHWVLSLLIPISLIGPECNFNSVSYWVRVAVHSVMAITNPYAIFFAPVHFVRAVFHRHRAAEIVYFLVATSFCGIQAVVLVFNLSSAASEAMTMIEVVRGYVACFVRLGVGWVLPPSVFQEVLAMLTFRHGVSWVGIGGLAYWSVAMILMIYGIILVGVRRAFSRIWVLVLCGGAVVIAGLGRGPTVYCADRYFYVPYVLLIVSLLKLMEMENVTHRARIVIGSVVGMYFLSSIPCYVLSELEDLHWKQEYSAALKDRSHRIKLHPDLNNIKWYLLLPTQETRELRFGTQMSVSD